MGRIRLQKTFEAAIEDGSLEDVLKEAGHTPALTNGGATSSNCAQERSLPIEEDRPTSPVAEEMKTVQKSLAKLAEDNAMLHQQMAVLMQEIHHLKSENTELAQDGTGR